MKKNLGFTLVEMAIVLLIIGLLIGGLMQPLSSQIDASRNKDAQNQLNTVQDALYGFAAANGRLPCPATVASNGSEDPVVPVASGACTAPYGGFVPGRQLGLSPIDTSGRLLDSWGNPVRYAVATLQSGVNYVVTLQDGIKAIGIPTFNGIVNNPPAANTLLLVCASSTGITTTTCGAGNGLTSNAVAVFYSTGPNGGSGGSGADEAQNPNPTGGSVNPFFVSHARSGAGATNGEFDDIVQWIPSNIFISKMLTAGRLP